MKVRVLLFASYAEALGTSELTLDVPDGTRAGEVLAKVRELTAATELPPSPLMAVNATYAPSSQQIEAGDEVAIIPPVAGG
jgi:molybdopterin converting factor subunit 1